MSRSTPCSSTSSKSFTYALFLSKLCALFKITTNRLPLASQRHRLSLSFLARSRRPMFFALRACSLQRSRSSPRLPLFLPRAQEAAAGRLVTERIILISSLLLIHTRARTVPVPNTRSHHCPSPTDLPPSPSSSLITPQQTSTWPCSLILPVAPFLLSVRQTH